MFLHAMAMLPGGVPRPIIGNRRSNSALHVPIIFESTFILALTIRRMHHGRDYPSTELSQGHTESLRCSRRYTSGIDPPQLETPVIYSRWNFNASWRHPALSVPRDRSRGSGGAYRPKGQCYVHNSLSQLRIRGHHSERPGGRRSIQQGFQLSVRLSQ